MSQKDKDRLTRLQVECYDRAYDCCNCGYSKYPCKVKKTVIDFIARKGIIKFWKLRKKY